MNKKSKKATGKKGEPEREKPGVESMRKNRLLVTKSVPKANISGAFSWFSLGFTADCFKCVCCSEKAVCVDQPTLIVLVSETDGK